MDRRIIWRYRLRSGKKKERRGEFFGLIRHHSYWEGQQLAMIRIDGNTRTTNVPVSELYEEEK